MKAVILAGGFGTRISEESSNIPKPMIKIGGMPILWHIMKTYSFYGINDFIICCGYKGHVIKEYFANYFLHMSDITLDLSNNDMKVHSNFSEKWKVTLVNTGLNTMTGGRLKKVKKYLKNEDFCFTYGDGLSNVNIKELIKYHKTNNVLVTTTAVQPPGRFGALEINGNKILNFKEKPDGDGSWINGGFFVLSPKVIDYIENDHIVWEQFPMEKLASEGNMNAFFHKGFWHPMDTLRDKKYLEKMWQSNSAKWKIWE